MRRTELCTKDLCGLSWVASSRLDIVPTLEAASVSAYPRYSGGGMDSYLKEVSPSTRMIGRGV